MRCHILIIDRHKGWEKRQCKKEALDLPICGYHRSMIAKGRVLTDIDGKYCGDMSRIAGLMALIERYKSR